MLKILFNINKTILNTKHRLMILVLIIINILAAGLEALSIYMFLPILAFFKDPQGYRPEDSLPDVLSNIVNMFSHLGFGTFIVAIAVFFVKAIVMSLISYGKNNIVSTIRHDLSILVYAQSIFQDYEKIVGSKISVLMNNVTASISHLSNGIIFSSINILIELFMITAIAIVLIMNNSIIALIVPLIVGVLCLGLIILLKKWANWVGKIRQKSETNRMQVLRESFASILEIKIYQSENYFKHLFADEERDIRRAGIGILTMAEVPKYILELLGVITIFMFFLVSYNFGDTETLLITNGLFAVAVIKLLPSLSKIIVAFNSMRSAKPAYEQVAEVFSYSVKNKHLYTVSKASSSFEKISSVNINALSYSYSANADPIVSGINIKLEQGNIFGLIGPSGSGKTTVLNLIAGVLFSTDEKTEYVINDKFVKNYNEEIQGHIGYVPQSPQMFNRTIAENIAFDQNPEEIDHNRVKASLIKAEAMSFVEKLPQGIESILSDGGMNFSGGQRQRLALARVLYRQPSIIILDEATNALDQATVEEFMKTIRLISKTTIVIIVSHSKNMIDFCDQLITIKKGNI